MISNSFILQPNPSQAEGLLFLLCNENARHRNSGSNSFQIKTAFSIQIARWLNTEIMNADSRQFYKGLNIGTAKTR